MTVILDGCHNGDSVSQFLSGIAALKILEFFLRHHAFLIGVRSAYPGRKILTLFGGGAEKCLDDMLVELASRSDFVAFVQSKHFKAIGEFNLFINKFTYLT